MAGTADLYSPKAKQRAAGERGKPYQRFLSWLSINHPGVWRLRLDILIALYAIFGITALFSPVFFGFLSGIDEDCAERSGTFVDCVDYVEQYTSNGTYETTYYWTTGFSSSAVMFIFFAFVFAGLAAALIWCYFVSRGMRLASVVAKLDSPRFLLVTLFLIPFVLAPFLAGYSAFWATHGGGIDALWTGQTQVQSLSGASLTLEFPGSIYGDEMIVLFLFGLAFATAISIGLRIVMLEGLVGLVKAIIIASILGTLTMVGFGVWNGLYDSIGFSLWIYVAPFFAIILFYLALFKRDLMMNRRHRFSQTIALSFALYWPGWAMLFFVILITEVPFFEDMDGTEWDGMIFMYSFYVLALLVEAMTFRDIARLKMLPKP